MSSSSAQSPSGPSADKPLLSQGNGNIHPWNRSLLLMVDLYPCRASAAIGQGLDRTPAAKPLPTLSDKDDEGNYVYEHKQNKATDAGSISHAGDLVAAKKEEVDDKKTTLELLKHIHSTVSLPSLQIAADDDFYAAHRGDPASLVHSLLRLHYTKDRTDIIASLKELSEVREVPISGNDDNSGRVLASKVRAIAESMRRNFGDTIPVSVLAAAALINGLDPNLHKLFIVYLGQQPPSWVKNQSAEAAAKAFEAITAAVIRECKTTNMTGAADADSRGSALALAAVGKPAAPRDAKPPADGIVQCVTCVAMKLSEPRLHIVETDHQAGSKACPMQRKLFGLVRRQLDQERQNPRDQKHPDKGRPSPHHGNKQGKQLSASALMGNESMDEFVARRTLEREWQQSNQQGGRGNTALSAAVSGAQRPQISDEEQERYLMNRLDVFTSHGLSRIANVSLSATGHSASELDAILNDALARSGSERDDLGDYDYDDSDDSDDGSPEARVRAVNALRAEYTALCAARDAAGAATTQHTPQPITVTAPADVTPAPFPAAILRGGGASTFGGSGTATLGSCGGASTLGGWGDATLGGCDDSTLGGCDGFTLGSEAKGGVARACTGGSGGACGARRTGGGCTSGRNISSMLGSDVAAPASPVNGKAAAALAFVALLVALLSSGSVSALETISSVAAELRAWAFSAAKLVQRFAFQSAFVLLLIGLLSPAGSTASAAQPRVAYPATTPPYGVTPHLWTSAARYHNGQAVWLADNACSSSQTNRLDAFPNGVVKLPAPVLISVASATSPPMYATHAGLTTVLPPYNKCFYVPDASVSLFSLGSVQRLGGSYGTDGAAGFVIRNGTGETIARLELDTNNTLPFVVSGDTASPATAAASVRVDGIQQFSERQCRRNDRVRYLHLSLNHPSDKTLSALLERYPGVGLTGADVDSARLQSGQCPICTVKFKRKIGGDSQSPEPPTVGHSLSIDLKGLPCPQIGGATQALLFVDRLSKYCGVVGCLTKQTGELLAAIIAIVDFYFSKYGHKVSLIYCDSEPCLLAMAEHLAAHPYNITLLPSPPYQHAQLIERHIQTVEDYRSVLLTALPYELPADLTLESYKYCTSMLNLLPNATSPGALSPSAVVTGRSSALKPEQLHPFGSMVMVQAPGGADEVGASRVLAIYLGPDNMALTSSRCLLIKPLSLNGKRVRSIVKRSSDMITAVSLAVPNWKRKPNICLVTRPQPGGPFYQLVSPGDRKIHQGAPDQEADDMMPPATPAVPAGELQAAPPAGPAAPAADPEAPAAHALPDALNGPEPAQDAPAILAGLPAAPVAPAAHADVQAAPAAVPAAGERRNPSRNKPRDHGVFVTDGSGAYNVTSAAPQEHAHPPTARQMTVKQGLREYPEATRAAILTEMEKQTTKYNVLRDPTREEYSMIYQAFRDVEDGKLSPPAFNLVYSKMFLKAKYDAKNIFLKMSARLVANGKCQKPNTFGETYSPTVDSSTRLAVTFAFAAWAAQQGRSAEIRHWSFDINGAFLHCDLESKVPVFVRLPNDIGPLSGKLKAVLRGLYGLKQVNRTFYEHLTTSMLGLGFAQSASDKCVYTRGSPGDANYTVAYFHVDDGFALSLSEPALQYLVDGLTAIYGELSLDKSGTSHAGWSLHRTDESLTISQTGYIMSIGEKYADLMASAPGPTPMTPHGPALFEEPPANATAVPVLSYQELIGSLMHCKQTRHDCCLVLSHLATKLVAPVQTDVDAAVHLLRYLVATHDTGPRLDFASAAKHGPRLFAYVDASYQSHPGSRSHGGLKLCIGPSSGSILSRSHPVTDVDVQLSTCEAEYVMLCFVGMQVEWLRALLASIGFPQDGPTVIFEDNQAAIGLALSPSLSRKTRHIATKFHYTKSLVAKGVIIPTYIDTLLNHADMISKAKFPSAAFHRRALDIFNNTRAQLLTMYGFNDTNPASAAAAVTAYCALAANIFGDKARGRTIDGLYGPKDPDLTAAAAYLHASTRRQ